MLQGLTVAVLQAASYLRKLIKQEPLPPHIRFEPVAVGQDEVQIFAYGRLLYDSMLAAIEQAQETIYLETFLWKSDEVGQAFKDRLERKAQQGVEVYVVYDDFGNLVVNPEFKRFGAGVHALAYRAFHRPWHLLDARRYALEHRKLLAVDGKTGFIGGYNLGAIYAEKWRDCHLRISGPAAADVADEFITFWNIHAPASERLTRRYRRRFNPLIRLEGTNALRLTFPIRNMYLQAIDKAQDSIRLTNAYFAPDGSLVEALLAAAQRGVDVQILLPWVSNHVVVDWLARGYFTNLLKAGVRLFGYRSMLHAKTCTIDGQWSTIGTANLDRLSAVGNYEINVEIYSADVAQQMEELFERDLEHAFELIPNEWERRPWIAKLGERILAPLREIL